MTSFVAENDDFRAFLADVKFKIYIRTAIVTTDPQILSSPF